MIKNQSRLDVHVSTRDYQGSVFVHCYSSHIQSTCDRKRTIRYKSIQGCHGILHYKTDVRRLDIDFPLTHGTGKFGHATCEN
jgi:hypothetical protein